MGSHLCIACEQAGVEFYDLSVLVSANFPCEHIYHKPVLQSLRRVRELQLEVKVDTISFRCDAGVDVLSGVLIPKPDSLSNAE